MPPDITPESIRGASFRTTLRGADTSEVSRFLEEVAASLEELVKDRDRLASRLGEFADKDLKTEFEVVGREVTAVLESAREAAATMRERATADAARWRSEAMAETEQIRKDAKNDAEALRGDAWAAGSDLLNQSAAEAKRMRESADRDAITITGEAEREAHRLVSGARREAEDVVRSASMDAEKITAEAEKARDDMIETARRQAEASQERTRALEQRREELMEELEGVRAALHQMEGTLEAKREDLNLSKTGDTSVRVIPSGRSTPPEPEAPANWAPGETVRIIRGEEDEPQKPDAPPAPEPPIETVKAEPLAPASRQPSDDSSSPRESDPDDVAPAPASDPPQPEKAGAQDDLGALFDSLRTPGAEQSPETVDTGPGNEGSKVPEPSPTVKAAPSRPDDGDALLEERDGALLPITNRSLRGVKRAVTEAQNIALDGLRTDTGWAPDRAQVSDILRADLITLWAESYSAGHDRAEAMTASKLKRPATPGTDSPEEFATALVADLSREIGSVGDGQRERQSAASKVFRGWRTDEAERRVRTLALRGFHRGLAESVGGAALRWVSSGTPCSACRAAAENPAANLPPVHAGCECTLAL